MPDMHPYIIPLIAMFEENSDPEYAVFMKKYMRNQFEYHGIKSPVRTAIQKDFWSQNGLPAHAELPFILKDLWNLDQREYQYFAMELTFRMIKKTEPDFVMVLEEMITSKSWWDTIDFIAAVLIGNLFTRYPELKNIYLSKWIDSGNIWLQRSCLLFQLKYKHKTDTELLSNLIIRLSGGREFFINKAIGWILREYSKTNSAWVVDFTMSHNLSNLSHREALKWLGKKELI